MNTKPNRYDQYLMVQLTFFLLICSLQHIDIYLQCKYDKYTLDINCISFKAKPTKKGKMVCLLYILKILGNGSKCLIFPWLLLINKQTKDILSIYSFPSHNYNAQQVSMWDIFPTPMVLLSPSRMPMGRHLWHDHILNIHQLGYGLLQQVYLYICKIIRMNVDQISKILSPVKRPAEET